MKRFALLIIALALFAIAAQSQTPVPATTNNSVWVITEYRFKPGASNARDYTQFLREHRVHVLTEQKQQGLILDFKYFHNDTTGGPNEVQLVEAVCYRDYEDALNPGGNEDRGKKLRDIRVKHYGSIENMQKATAPIQTWVDVVRRYVLHEMTINPAKPAAGSGN